MAEAVSSLNCEITIVGRKRGDCCDNNAVPFKTKRFRMLFKRGYFFYKFFNIRLFIFLLFHKYDLLVSNDLDTLLPNFLVAKLKDIPLVYDSHEYFTGVPEIQNRPVVKWVWLTIEQMIFPHLKFVITVNESIANLYASQYNVRPSVIRNCSPKTEGIIPFDRNDLGVGNDHLLIIIQGAGINIDRGGEELIEAVSMTENVSLLVVGGGDVLETLKRKVMEKDLEGRVKFFGKVQWKELMRYTKSADAGITIDKDTNPNYRYSLPNKLFDYFTSGIPVIASNLPEVRKIVTGYKCGVIIPGVTPEEISLAIQQLRDNPDLLSELKRNAVIASESENWEKESLKVIGFYENVLKNIFNI